MFVFDASALIALFDSYEPVFSLWRRANQNRALIGFPAVAMVEASDRIGIVDREWEALLLAEGVVVLPLAETASRQLGSWNGTVAARNAMWESQMIGWPVITCDPKQYESDVLIYPV
jgi:hypothetical protein